MKNIIILLFALACGLMGLKAEEAKPVDPPTATIINSEVFRLDMLKKQGVFSGNVDVTAPDMKLKCDEMTVFFSAGGDGKVEKLIARGNVVIEQSDKTAKSNQAEYVVADDKMTLNGSPEITLKNGTRTTGSVITIYRSNNRIEIGPRSHVILYDNLSGPAAGTAVPPTK